MAESTRGKALEKMNGILAEDGLSPPKLKLAAKVTPRERAETAIKTRTEPSRSYV